MAQARRTKKSGGTRRRTTATKTRFRLKVHMRDGRTTVRSFSTKRELEKAAEELYGRGGVRYVEVVRIERR